MRKVCMVGVIVLSVCVLFFLSQVIIAQQLDWTGIYKNNAGEQLKVTHIGGAEYKLECFECRQDVAWETIGFLSKSGNYFKGVFRYINVSKYEDHVGFHKVEILKDGKIRVFGGWEALGEFGKEGTEWIRTEK